ncbi:DUF4468 domain-containing protein [Flavobacterium sediminilitoris]|uniref:DUF4468 domain-containing protein n=1 Tax=Flavobacterium sediminilitoris TaxID=2024526 RepID=A0ABY4HHV3_9FLAO|nr:MULTISPECIES: DUF4468 domain-containing protein [Flavobacterium]UOX32412.1 DUF4468 domain-containing protein [Flavobacterium sediminilitoris]
MKKIILLVLISFYSFGQELPKLTENGFEPIVVEIKDKTAAEIYVKAKEWIQTYYKNPTEVLKGDIENNMIRINGFANEGYQTKALGIVNYYDYSYVIEINFKDGKYRFNYIIGQFYAGSKKASYSYKYFFKSDGSIKKTQKVPFDTLNETASNTSISFYNYVSGNIENKKSDW